MTKENAGLKKIDKTRNYLLEEIKDHNFLKMYFFDFLLLLAVFQFLLLLHYSIFL